MGRLARATSSTAATQSSSVAASEDVGVARRADGGKAARYSKNDSREEPFSAENKDNAKNGTDGDSKERQVVKGPKYLFEGKHAKQ